MVTQLTCGEVDRPWMAGRKIKTQSELTIHKAVDARLTDAISGKTLTQPMLPVAPERDQAARQPDTGAVWLSSARVVRCCCPQRKRNPLSLVATKGHSNETAGDKPEEGGDDVKSSWPRIGPSHVIQWSEQIKRSREVKPIQKIDVSGLQVCNSTARSRNRCNRGSACRGEPFPVLYTPPVTPWEWVHQKTFAQPKGRRRPRWAS